jgi:Na+/melibiose symporter-like transporter
VGYAPPPGDPAQDRVGFLFSLSAWTPFAVDAVSFAAGSALVASIRGHFGPAAEDLGPRSRRTSLRTEIAEGLRWMAAHRVLRATAAMVAVVNLLASGGGAVMVLFAQEKLGVDAVGFGLLFSGSAVGGVLGSLVAARVTRVVGTARVVVWTMVTSTLAYLVFGLSSDPWLAGLEPGP